MTHIKLAERQVFIDPDFKNKAKKKNEKVVNGRSSSWGLVILLRKLVIA